MKEQLSSIQLNFKPKTASQRKFLSTIDSNEITIGIGQAGSGKTYAVMAYALDAILKGNYEQMVLIRPLVINEEVGYLKGGLQEKLQPYYYLFEYIMDDLLDGSHIRKQLYENKKIKDLSLGFCRGITFRNTIIIADEMQNATPHQFKTLLTRIGANSKMIITGDIEQIDLKYKNQSGLEDALARLENRNGIGVFEFDTKDNVRNPIINTILDAYSDEYDEYSLPVLDDVVGY